MARSPGGGDPKPPPAEVLAFLDFKLLEVHHFMNGIRFPTVAFQISLHQGRRGRTRYLLKLENEGCVKTFSFEQL